MKKKILLISNEVIKILKNNWKNFSWVISSQFIVTLSSLIISVLFTRLTSKENYSYYLLLLSFFDVFAVLSLSGVFSLILIQGARGNYSFFTKATNLSLKSNIILIPTSILIGLYYFAFEHNKILGYGLIFFALLLPFYGSLKSWRFLLQGLSKFKNIFFYDLLRSIIIILSMALALTIFKVNSLISFLIYISIHTISNLLLFLYYRKKYPSKKEDFSKKNKHWKKQSYELTFINISVMLTDRADILVIGLLLPIEQVAIYGLTKSFIAIFLESISKLIEVIRPKIFKSDTLNINYFFKYFWLLFIIPIISFFLIKYPVLFLYGEDYIEIVKWSQIYTFIIPIVFLLWISFNYLLKYDLTGKANRNKIIGTIATFSLFFVFIPFFKIGGIIVSVLIGYTLQIIMNINDIKKYEYLLHRKKK